MRLSVELPDELHRRAKVKAAQEGTTVSDVVRRSIEGWVGRIEEPHMEGDVRVIDKAKLLAVSIDSTPSLYPGASIQKVTLTDAVSKTTVPKSTAKRPLPDFSKSAQAKGKMGR